MYKGPAISAGKRPAASSVFLYFFLFICSFCLDIFACTLYTYIKKYLIIYRLSLHFTGIFYHFARTLYTYIIKYLIIYRLSLHSNGVFHLRVYRRSIPFQ